MPSIREVKRIKSITLLVGAPTKDTFSTVNWTGSLWWFFFPDHITGVTIWFTGCFTYAVTCVEYGHAQQKNLAAKTLDRMAN
jgi:hypothetical protein